MSKNFAHRILVIDDQAAIHDDYTKVLSKEAASNTAALDRAAAELFGDAPEPLIVWEGFDIDSAFQGQEGVELVERALVQRRPYALAFVDIRMPPGWDGVETVRRIWEIDPEILVVICSAYSDYSWQEMVRKLGRSDRFLILRKPFDNIEVRQLAMALTERWSQSRTDVLTELLNRRALSSYLELEWKRSVRQQQPLSCAMLDLDHFKRVNDSFGHQAGDEVLRRVAQILVDQRRTNDSVYRYGGEEICVLLPQTSEHDAIAWADRMRRTIEATLIQLEDRQLSVTISIGVAERHAEDDRPEQLIDRADQALIFAKSAGRNRVVAAQSVSSIDKHVDALRGIVLKDVMLTKFAVLKTSSTLAEALLAIGNSSVGSLPVVDDVGAMIGVVSEQDLLEALPSRECLGETVERVMYRNYESLALDAPMSAVVAVLEKPTVPRVFVLKHGKPVGVVNRGSILRHWAHVVGLPQAETPVGAAGNAPASVPRTPAPPLAAGPDTGEFGTPDTPLSPLG